MVIPGWLAWGNYEGVEYERAAAGREDANGIEIHCLEQVAVRRAELRHARKERGESLGVARRSTAKALEEPAGTRPRNKRMSPHIVEGAKVQRSVPHQLHEYSARTCDNAHAEGSCARALRSTRSPRKPSPAPEHLRAAPLGRAVALRS